MISTYIFYIQYLHLKDNFLALILPGIMNVFYLLIMRSFVNTVPTALIESAKIDGAGEFRIFVQIVLPPAEIRSCHHRPVHGPGLLERLVQCHALHEY